MAPPSRAPTEPPPPTPALLVAAILLLNVGVGVGVLGAVPAPSLPRTGSPGPSFEASAIGESVVAGLGAGTSSPSLGGGASTSGPSVSAGLPPTWIDMTSRYSKAPSARAFGAMAWDIKDSYAVLFGGENGGTSPDGDTWTFSPTAGWQEICSSCSPTAVAEPEFGYDSTANVIVMFGGCESLGTCPIAATWTYSGGTWTSSKVGTQPTQDMVGMMADDPADGVEVMYGGCSDFSIDILDPGDSACSSTAYLDTTYTFTPSSGWTSISSTNVPPEREAAGMAYDPLTQQVLLYGGYNGNVGLSDMWAYHAGEWYELHPATTPGVLSNFAMAWDPSLDGMLAFGGDTATATVNTTWLYTDGNWTQLNPATSPQARDGTMIASPPTGFPVLYGGETSGGSNNLADTWVFGPQLSVSPTVTPLDTDVGQTVAFSAIVSGGQPPYTVSWNYGDGSTPSTSGNVTHVYTTAGSYTATLSVTDTYGFSASQTFSLVISPLPTVTAQASPVLEGLGNSTSFWANATGGTPTLTYSWSFDDGATSPSADPVHTYSTPGYFNATVSVVDAVGQVASATVMVDIKAPPGAIVVSISATPSSGTLPLTVAFDTTVGGGIGPYSYSWEFGDGSAPSLFANATHRYNQTGVFRAVLTVKDPAGRTGNASAGITVKPGPLSASLLASPMEGDSGVNVTFNASALGGAPPYTFSWEFGDGSISSARNPWHVYALAAGDAATTFPVELKVSDSNVLDGSAPAFTNITVYPTLAVNLTVPSQPPKVGATVPFTAQALGGKGPYQFAWDFGDGTFQNVTSSTAFSNTTHVYSTNVTRQVTVVITDAFGSEASASGTVSPGGSTASANTGGGLAGLDPIGNDPLYLLLPMAIVLLLAVAIVFGVRGRRLDRDPFQRRPPPPTSQLTEPAYYPFEAWKSWK